MRAGNQCDFKIEGAESVCYHETDQNMAEQKLDRGAKKDGRVHPDACGSLNLGINQLHNSLTFNVWFEIVVLLPSVLSACCQVKLNDLFSNMEDYGLGKFYTSGVYIL